LLVASSTKLQLEVMGRERGIPDPKSDVFSIPTMYVHMSSTVSGTEGRIMLVRVDQFLAIFTLSKRYKVKSFDFKLFTNLLSVFKAIDASKVPGPSFFCHFFPKNYPRTKHTKTYNKVQAFFVKTSTRGSYLSYPQKISLFPPPTTPLPSKPEYHSILVKFIFYQDNEHYEWNCELTLGHPQRDKAWWRKVWG
jgi:hypothetical protein